MEEKIEGKSLTFLVSLVVLVYSFLVAEFLNMFYEKVVFKQLSIDLNEIILNVVRLNYFLTIAMVFIVYVISILLFHLVALLFDGVGKFSHFMKMAGIAYIIPSVFFTIAILLLTDIHLIKTNSSDIFDINPKLKDLMLITTIGSYIYYFTLIPIVKRIYKINWIKAFSAILIPIVSIYLLSFLF